MTASMPSPLLLREDSTESALQLVRSLTANRHAGPIPSPVITEEQQRALVDALLGAVGGIEHFGGCEIDLDYTDSWPTVEVSVGINEILRVDVQDLTFDADFVIFLDWLDPKLRRGEHYTYNAEHGKFELMRTLRDCKDDLRFFNPAVTILNSKQEAEEADHLPQVLDEVLRDNQDVPWLTKKFHFVGTLTCRGVNAKYFPFDIEDLQIRISCPEMAGVTSLGQDRRVELVEPVLRKQWRRSKRCRDGSWAQPRQEEEGMGHMWSAADLNDYNGLGVGEMNVLAFGGVSQPEGQEYTLHIVFCRQWYPRYVFDFLILNLQVGAAMSSLYVPFSSDMLANRMSITLTVMLTLVASASARPPAIESLPYSTLHDTYGQLTLFSVAIVGLGNWVVFQNCWGMYRTAGLDDVYDDGLKMVVNHLSNGPLGDWVCEEGKCGSSNIDCLILYFSFASAIVAILVILTTSQMHRISMMLRIKHEVDATDETPPIYSRLILCSRGFFLFKRMDIVSCAAHVALMPCVSLFIKSWRALRRLKYFVCCCWEPRQSGMYSSLRQQDVLLGMARETADKAKTLPSISRFNVKLAPTELFRVLDVGSGEMGFYSYWLDEASGCICASGTESKLKYNKNQTFVSHFLHSPTGVEEMAQQIIQRFELSPVLPMGAPKVAMSGSPSQEDLSGLLPKAPSAEDSPATQVQALLVSALQEDNPPRQPEVGLPGAPACLDREANRSFGGLQRSFSPESHSVRSATPSSPTHRAARVSQLQKTMGASGTGFRFGGKRKLIVCLTGANRQMLRDDAEGRAALQAFIRGVNERVEKFGAECITYMPEDSDEAMYELWATEWVVQHGDLDVKNVELEKVYRTLQGGREEASATLQEIEMEFRDLQAEDELRVAYCRAATYSRAAQHHGPISEHPHPPPTSVLCSAFYASFEASPPLLRALMRARLFSGTLSAGSGSSQVTLRCATSLESSQVHSVPLGNRTPLVSMTFAENACSPFSPSLPKTCKLARQLLTDETQTTVGKSPSKESKPSWPEETRPAWPEDGPVDRGRLDLWRQLVASCAEERGLPTQQRGLFVGISAIFYAAKLAGCAGEVMPRDAFLLRLAKRRGELLEDGKGSGRDLANLTLVMTLVEYVLHRTAIIVCKRMWRVGDPGSQSDFVATWTLGMYLKHSGAMGGSIP